VTHIASRARNGRIAKRQTDRARGDRGLNSPPPPASRVRQRAVLIAIAVLVTFWTSLSGPFVFDDESSIVHNQQIRHVEPASVFFPDQDSPTAGRPLVNVSFAMNYAIGGLDVRGYHAFNIALHLLCALLVFGIVRRTLESPAIPADVQSNAVDLAFATALLWALHPLNTEVVDYLTQRSESMMALFYLATLYAAIRAGRSHRLAWQTTAVISCGLGMACKESMVTAPLMVAAYDWAFTFDSWRQMVRNRGRFYAGLGATWLILAALLWSGPRVHSAGFSTNIGVWTYLLNQTLMITHYLRLAIWPRALVLNYGVPRLLTAGDVWPYLLVIALLLLITIVALFHRRRLGFLGLWVFVTLSPTSSVVPIATEVGAERRMYLPLIGLMTLAVVGCFVAWSRGRRLWAGDGAGPATAVTPLGAPFLLITLLLSAVLAAASITRTREYASGVSLARTVLERHPSSIAHFLMGTELLAAGEAEEAGHQLRAAIPGAPRARYALGFALIKQGALDEAIEQLQAFVREEPMLLEVISARGMLGSAFATERRWPQAIEQFRLILTMSPSSVEVQGRLADALFAEQTFEEAIPHYREYLKVRPDDAGALSKLGIALASTGQSGEAIPAFRRAVDLEPRNPDAHRNLATALFDRHAGDEAVVHARKAVTLTPDNPAALDLLGRILAVEGQLDDARIQFERALTLEPSYAQAREDLAKVRQLRGVPGGDRRRLSPRDAKPR
jgi:Flp pilus assembly protein TadD